MQFLQGLPEADILAISEYLNSQAVSGEQRYITGCAGCHGNDASGGFVKKNLRGKRNINLNQRMMQFLRCLPRSDTNEIGAFLSGLAKKTKAAAEKKAAPKKTK